jgi:hypothetical protein
VTRLEAERGTFELGAPACVLVLAEGEKGIPADFAADLATSGKLLFVLPDNGRDGALPPMAERVAALRAQVGLPGRRTPNIQKKEAP